MSRMGRSQAPTTCTICGEKAAYRQVYSGTSFCPACFKDSIEKRVRKTISKYNLLRENDRILVAVSGGKDSLSLLKILAKIEKSFPRASIVAVSVDEGIPGYRDEALRLASEMCKKLDVEHRAYSFEDLFGSGLSDLIKSGGLSRLGLGPCTLCGVWRRKAISLAAREVDATVVATAHTLDDIVQTYIMDILRGSFPRAPIGLRREGNGIIPRVAPFRNILEEEVVLYAFFSKIPFQETPCPNAENSQRDLVRTFLTKFESEYRGSLFAALKAIESNISPLEGVLNACKLCGEPTSREVCRACELEAAVFQRIERDVRLLRPYAGVYDV